LDIVGGRRIGREPAQAARMVEALSAFVSVGGASLIVSTISGPPAGMIAAIAIMIPPSFLESHGILLSEPSFLALFLLALGLMIWGRSHPLVLGLVIAAATMVRYVSLGILMAVAVWYL